MSSAIIRFAFCYLGLHRSLNLLLPCPCDLFLMHRCFFYGSQEDFFDLVSLWLAQGLHCVDNKSFLMSVFTLFDNSSNTEFLSGKTSYTAMQPLINRHHLEFLSGKTSYTQCSLSSVGTSGCIRELNSQCFSGNCSWRCYGFNRVIKRSILKHCPMIPNFIMVFGQISPGLYWMVKECH